MSNPIFKAGDKTVDLNKVRFDLLSRDQSKGAFQIIFKDGSELFLSCDEYMSILGQVRAWRKAGGTS